jgi:hypothetical protein
MKDKKLKLYQQNYSADVMVNGEWDNVVIKKNSENNQMRVKVFQQRYRTKEEHIALYHKIIEILEVNF